MNKGEYKIIIGAFEFGGISPEPIQEAYDTADSFYEPGLDMTVLVYLDEWGDDTFVELPYAGPSKEKSNE